MMVAFVPDETSDLKEKINECRHNEIVTYIVCAVGIVFFSFGLILSLLLVWLGALLFIGGLALNVNYSLRRFAHQKQLEHITGKDEKNQ